MPLKCVYRLVKCVQYVELYHSTVQVLYLEHFLTLLCPYNLLKVGFSTRVELILDEHFNATTTTT